jgi:putative oxidoreductase
MIKSILSPDPLWQSQGLGFVRVVLGLLMVYHGLEVFDDELMSGYLKWETFQQPYSKFMVYAGKTSELVAGVLIFLGLFTRIGALLAIGTFSYITFFVGHGKFWYEDQHPFMFALTNLIFFFNGPASWSLDGLFFKKIK